MLREFALFLEAERQQKAEGRIEKVEGMEEDKIRSHR
jgi:hypothetical protein